ncbi:hypothetical protein IJ531_01110 [bacterium]|nr:hypothetical protein [bacterium]
MRISPLKTHNKNISHKGFFTPSKKAQERKTEQNKRENYIGSFVTNYHMEAPNLENARDEYLSVFKKYVDKYDQLHDMLEAKRDLYEKQDDYSFDIGDKLRVYLKNGLRYDVNHLGNVPAKIPTRVIYRRDDNNSDIYDFQQGVIALDAKTLQNGLTHCRYLLFINPESQITAFDNELLFAKYINKPFVAKNVTSDRYNFTLSADCLTTFDNERNGTITGAQTYLQPTIKYGNHDRTHFKLSAPFYLQSAFYGHETLNKSFARDIVETHERSEVISKTADAMLKLKGSYSGIAKIGWVQEQSSIGTLRETCDYSDFVQRHF